MADNLVSENLKGFQSSYNNYNKLLKEIYGEKLQDYLDRFENLEQRLITNEKRFFSILGLGDDIQTAISKMTARLNTFNSDAGIIAMTNTSEAGPYGNLMNEMLANAGKYEAATEYELTTIDPNALDGSINKAFVQQFQEYIDSEDFVNKFYRYKAIWDAEFSKYANTPNVASPERNVQNTITKLSEPDSFVKTFGIPNIGAQFGGVFLRTIYNEFVEEFKSKASRERWVKDLSQEISEDEWTNTISKSFSVKRRSNVKNNALSVDEIRRINVGIDYAIANIQIRKDEKHNRLILQLEPDTAKQGMKSKAFKDIGSGVFGWQALNSHNSQKSYTKPTDLIREILIGSSNRQGLIQDPEIKQYVDYQLTKNITLFESSLSNTSNIAGFLGEVKVAAMLAYVVQDNSVVSPSGVSHYKQNYSNTSGKEIPTDIFLYSADFLEKFGFQVKNYKTNTGFYHAKEDRPLPSYLTTYMNLSPESQIYKILLNFFADEAYFYNVLGSDTHPSKKEALEANEKLTDISMAYLPELLAIQRNYIMDSEQINDLENAVKLNTFYWFGDYLVPASAIVGGIKDTFTKEMKEKASALSTKVIMPQEANLAHLSATRAEKMTSFVSEASKSSGRPNRDDVANLVDVNWTVNLDLKNIVTYAQSRGVRAAWARGSYTK